MRTKRQPTIKTLLLLMTVTAVQLALYPYKPRYVRLTHLMPAEEIMVCWLPFASAMAFWLALPLTFSVMCRSVKRIGAICFGFGVVWIVMTWLVRPYFETDWSDFVSNGFTGVPGIIGAVLVGTFDGPFCLAFPMYHYVSGFSFGLNSIWLAAYSLLGILIAKSCRLREVPSVLPARDKSSA